jgi:hypothetical protein
MIPKEQLPFVYVRNNELMRIREYYDIRTGEVLKTITHEMLERCPNVSADYLARELRGAR